MKTSPVPPVTKRDLKRELRPFYDCSAAEVSEVIVPPADFLAIDGRGDPNTAPAYALAVEALFSVAYTLKFAVKKSALAIDDGVMPLEGLWWADDMAAFSVDAKADWQWTMMIRQPEFVTAAMVEQAKDEVMRRKRLPRAGAFELRRFDEGACVQIQHVGPFADEGPTVARLHEHLARNGRRLAGKHHEIYLSDIRKAAPAKWRTIIRQPFA